MGRARSQKHRPPHRPTVMIGLAKKIEVTAPGPLLRYRSAYRYLDMGRWIFDQYVRPHLTEIPIGGVIYFSRVEIDAWVADTQKAHGRPGKKPQKEKSSWGEKSRRASSNKATSGIS